MTRRSLFSMLIVFITMMAASFVTGTRSASAQNNPNVCTYTIDVQGVSDSCFPFKVLTAWNCGGAKRVDSRPISANGIYVFPLNPGGIPPCPPACKFLWATINGLGPNTLFGGTTRYVVGNCCYILSVGLDAAGGIYIKIRPC